MLPLIVNKNCEPFIPPTMLKKILFMLLPLAVVGQNKIDYKIHYAKPLEQEGLRVEVSYRLKKAADSTYFHYSNEVWGEQQLTNCLRFVTDENPGYRFKIVADSNRVVVYHPKGTSLHFCYRVWQDVKQQSPKSRNRPIVNDQYFHILGQSLFAVPEAVFESATENPKIKARIEWVDFPKDFVIHNTFGSNQLKQQLDVKLWTDLYNSLFVGGDYRIKSFTFQDKPVYFAIRGNWLADYKDDKLFGALQKTITTQREFWKDNSFDYYTVIMTPTLTQNDSLYKGQSITGSGVKNGFLIQSSNNPFNSFYTMQYIFSHEMLHDWIGGKIPMRNEELNYWFSEGFTDYYAYKNRLRSGELSFEEWRSDFNNDVLAAHFKNPDRNKPNYLIKDDFWKSRTIEKIPYRRGAIFALWLDNQILRKSNYTKSLDDLMRDILEVCSKQQKKFSDELFLEIAQRYLDRDLNYFFQKHVINGVDFEFKDGDFIEGLGVVIDQGIPQLTANQFSINRFVLP